MIFPGRKKNNLTKSKWYDLVMSIENFCHLEVRMGTFLPKSDRPRSIVISLIYHWDYVEQYTSFINEWMNC